MKRLFTEYWKEFDVQYIKNMYGAELPLFYFVIYWSWSLVFGNAAGTDATSVTGKIILAAAVIFPTVFSFISYTLHPIALSKQMYLCPLGSQERQKLVMDKYRFRVGLHMTVCVAGTVLAAFMTRGALYWYLLILWNDFIISIFIPSEPEKTDRRTKELIYKNIMIPVVLILNAVYFENALNKENIQIVYTVLIAGFIGLVQLPLFIWYVRRVKSHIRSAVFYKTGINVRGRAV